MFVVKTGKLSRYFIYSNFLEICWYIFILKTCKVFEPLYFEKPFINHINVLHDELYF